MTGPGEQFDAFCDFVDGKTAVAHRAGLRFTVTGIAIFPPEGKRLSWRFADIRTLRDQAGGAGAVFYCDADKAARLYVSASALAGQIASMAPNLSHRPAMRNKGRLFSRALGAVASVALIIFVLVPLMADQLARYLPPEGEKALGDATFEQIRRALGENQNLPIRICEAPAGAAALEAMGVRLDPGGDMPFALSLHVLDHEMPNAFALPGGHVVVFRGLIDMAESPDEVAAVLAHEIGHVVARDPTRGALRTAGSVGVLGLLFGDFSGGTAMLFLLNQLINASYSQKAEAAADTYAHELLAKVGVSPAALGRMFERLRARYGDAEGIIAHFVSHPQLAERIEASAEAAAGQGEGAPVLSAQEWRALTAICGGPVRPPAPAGPKVEKRTGGKK